MLGGSGERGRSVSSLCAVQPLYRGINRLSLGPHAQDAYYGGRLHGGMGVGEWRHLIVLMGWEEC